MDSSSSRRTFKRKVRSTKSTKKNGWGVDTEKCVIRYKVLYLTRIGKWTTFFRPSTRQARLGKAVSEHGIPFVAHQTLRLFCKGEPLRQTYMPDLVRHESIIVEYKAQVSNYLSNGIVLCKAFRGKRPQASKKSFLKS